ncbi:hypothetical protein NDU88_002098, partial [Pleurodeles waltl]
MDRYTGGEPSVIVTAAVTAIGAHRSRNPPQSCVHRPSRSGAVAVAIIRLGSQNAVKEAGEPMEGGQLLSDRSASHALKTDGVRNPGWAGPTGLGYATTRKPS